MINYTKQFDKVGKKGVELYKQSLSKNDRVATGKTKNSIRFESSKNKITFYALDHIRDLENGKTAQQVQQEAKSSSFFDQIDDWVKSRGIGANTSTIARSLIANGWNTTRPNRTNPNGGTKGIITDIDKIVTDMVIESVLGSAKKDILDTLKITK